MLDAAPLGAAGPERVPVWYARTAAGMALSISALAWVGWATGNEDLTRISPSLPYNWPWSALITAVLGVSILAQLGHPSSVLVWAGRALAAAAGGIAAVFGAEYASGTSFGLDQAFFSDQLAAMQATWPGRPSASTAVSAVLLAVVIALTRLDRRWARVAWPVCLVAAAVLPTITVLRYAFEALLLMDVTRSTGQSIGAIASLLLLITAVTATRPDRWPLAWLLARPDRWGLVRMVGIFAGLPLVMGLARLAFLAVGLRGDSVWILSILVGSVVVGVAALFVSQREQRLLIEKESLARQSAERERQRADADAHYRILADNAVDVVIHTRGVRVGWISPSVQAAFGDPPRCWIGSDFLARLHPDDADIVTTALQEIAAQKAVIVRFRLRAANGAYHWVDGHGKLYAGHAGNSDGVIWSIRVVDDQVETQRQLERMAHFDSLTGLTNRAETFARLESGLTCSRVPGTEMGLLFCDVDKFKAVNDTLGHTAGDALLQTVAERISQCVRHGDTVGRTGGDEMMVLLPGLHSLDEATRIGEKILARAAEPIHHNGSTFRTTLSIGATLAIPGESATDATARADTAMYQAKQQGGNAVVSV